MICEVNDRSQEALIQYSVMERLVEVMVISLSSIQSHVQNSEKNKRNNFLLGMAHYHHKCIVKKVTNISFFLLSFVFTLFNNFSLGKQQTFCLVLHLSDVSQQGAGNSTFLHYRLRDVLKVQSCLNQTITLSFV